MPEIWLPSVALYKDPSFVHDGVGISGEMLKAAIKGNKETALEHAADRKTLATRTGHALATQTTV